MGRTLKISRFFVTYKLVFLLSVPSVPIAFSEAHEDSTSNASSCWLGPVPEGVDPCGLMEQAQGLLADIPAPAEGHVRELAAGLERSPITSGVSKTSSSIAPRLCLCSTDCPLGSRTFPSESSECGSNTSLQRDPGFVLDCGFLYD
jgi:hypothetical protein